MKFIVLLMSLCNGQIINFDHDLEMKTDRPLVIAHRGHSGALPEHTAEAYKLAIDEGADFIECDVTLTKDLVTICLHESWINKSTNVASVFPDRSNTYWVEDQKMFITDYFSIDFTLDEIQKLGKIQQFDFRDQRYNGQFRVATLQDLIVVAKHYSESKSIGIYVELKDPIFMNNFINTSTIANTTDSRFEDKVLKVLEMNGYTESKSNCLVQSFNEESLIYAKSKTKLKLVLLLDFSPTFDYTSLDRIARVAYGVGPDKRLLVPTENRVVQNRTDFVRQCHSRGLKVHPYTFRNEDRYLAWDYRQDYANEFRDFFNLSVDGLFTDFPGSYRLFLDCRYAPVSANIAEFLSPVAVTFYVGCLLYIICKL